MDCTRTAQAKTAPASLFDAFAASTSKNVDAFLADVAKQGGAPLEDPNSDRVIFLARGAPPSGPWSVAGSFTNWKTNAKPMVAVGGTDLWILDTTLPRKDGAATYKLLSGTSDSGFREDLLAMNVVWDGIDHQTVGEFNAIVHANEPSTKGRLVRWRNVPSPSGARDVFTWLPARYDDGSCAKLPVMIVHDGNESLTRGDFASVADAQPSNEQNVLVFVALPSQDIRIDEYTFNMQTAKAGPYVGFLASDLLPRVRTAFHVCSAQAATGISGASLGGLVSAWAAFEKPQTFGFVGSQSGSFFWDNESLVTRAAQTQKLSVSFHLDHGCPNDNCDSNRDMNGALVGKGYDVVHVEDPGAQHDWSFWKNRLPGLLHDFAVRAKCE
jgi:enterochelin esterase family protein